MRDLSKLEREEMITDHFPAADDDYLDKYWEETQAHFEKMRDLEPDYSFEPTSWEPPRWEDRASEPVDERAPSENNAAPVAPQPGREPWEANVSFEKAERSGQTVYDYCMEQRDSAGAPVFNSSEASTLASTVSKCEVIKANAELAAADAMSRRETPITQEEFEVASKRLEELRTTDGPAYGRVIGPDGQQKLAHESSTWERCEQYLDRFEPWQNEVSENAAIVRQYELEREREREKIEAEQKAVTGVEDQEKDAPQHDQDMTPEQGGASFQELQTAHEAQVSGGQQELPGLESTSTKQQENPTNQQPDMMKMASAVAGVPNVPKSPQAKQQEQEQQQDEPEME